MPRHYTVNNVSELANIGGAIGDTCQTLGYYAAGDGGGDLLQWTVSGTTTDNGFVHDAPGAGGERWEAVDKSVANVRKFGAKGDYTTDDYAAINSAIGCMNTDGNQCGTLSFPRGTYRVNTTLNFGTLRGFTVVGEGPDTVQTATTTFKSAASRVCWGGTDGGTLMRIDGRNFALRDLGLYGSLLPDDFGPNPTARAAIGVQLGYTAGIGSGDGVVDNVRFCDFDIAWKNGIALLDNNCADITFNGIECRYCDIGMLTVNSQGLNYSFDYINFLSCGTCFKFISGGGLQANYVHASAVPVILHLASDEFVNGVSGDTGSIGGDVSTFVLSQIKVEGDLSGVVPQIVRVTDDDISGSPKVIVRAARINGTMLTSDTTPQFLIKGGTTLYVSDFNFINDGGVIVHLESSNASFSPTAMFERCTTIHTSGDMPPNWLDATSYTTAFTTTDINTTSNTVEEPLTTGAAMNGTRLRLSRTAAGGDALPAPLATGTEYYIRNADGAGFQLSATPTGAIIDITDVGQGTFTAHYGTNNPAFVKELGIAPVKWRFRDCLSVGLNRDCPNIGGMKIITDPNDTIVTMRLRNRLRLNYTTAAMLLFITLCEDGTEIEVECNANASIWHGNTTNSFKLAGAVDFTADAQGARFMFVRKGGIWEEKSRTVY